MKSSRLTLVVLLWAPLAALNATEQPAAKPNIVVILADDLGYGDLQCYNRDRGKIATPNLDRLAAQGMRFTDGHSSSGVCSPSRYTLLTGRYHWRTRLQSGIVGVFGEPLIAPDRLTIAGLAKEHGYRTGLHRQMASWLGLAHRGGTAAVPARRREARPGRRGNVHGGTAVRLERDLFAAHSRRPDHAAGFDIYCWKGSSPTAAARPA